jgi:hypothetical protein
MHSAADADRLAQLAKTFEKFEAAAEPLGAADGGEHPQTLDTSSALAAAFFLLALLVGGVSLIGVYAEWSWAHAYVRFFAFVALFNVPLAATCAWVGWRFARRLAL